MRSLERILDADLVSLASYASLPTAVAEAMRIQRDHALREAVEEHLEPLATIVRDGAKFAQNHYSGVIINLYGLVEQFLEELVVDAIDAIASASPTWDSLPKVIRSHHTTLSIELIRVLQSGRAVTGTNLEQAVANLSFCLKESAEFVLNSRSFAHHTANFRHANTVELLSRMGVNASRLERDYLDDCEASGVSPHPDWLSPAIDELAERRNLVAHGRIDELLSPELLVTMIELMRIYLAQVSRAVLDSVVRHTIAVGGAVEIGRPDHVWRGGDIIGFEHPCCDLRVGDYLAAVPSGRLSSVLNVVSLQSDGEDRENVAATEPCGARVDPSTSPRHRIWRLPRDVRFWM